MADRFKEALETRRALSRRNAGGTRPLRRGSMPCSALALMAALAIALASSAPALASTRASDRFSDVSAGAWYADDVQWVVDGGLMSGYSGTAEFGVGEALTRAELAAILARHAGADTSSKTDATGISDLEKGGQWYTGSVNWAVAEGVITGYTDAKGDVTAFGPNDGLSREQAMVALARYAAECGLDTTSDASSLAAFVDKDEISPWASASCAWAVGEQIASGSAGRLDPSRNVKREEIAKMVRRTVAAIDASHEDEGPAPRTLSIGGSVIPYVDSYGAAEAPETGAGIWQGSDSTTDGSYAYFIGHNPGPFKDVARLQAGDVVSVCDGEGNRADYEAVEIFDVHKSTRWDQVFWRVASHGESVALQTCIGDSRRIVVCELA